MGKEIFRALQSCGHIVDCLLFWFFQTEINCHCNEDLDFHYIYTCRFFFRLVFMAFVVCTKIIIIIAAADLGRSLAQSTDDSALR